MAPTKAFTGSVHSDCCTETIQRLPLVSLLVKMGVKLGGYMSSTCCGFGQASPSDLVGGYSRLPLSPVRWSRFCPQNARAALWICHTREEHEAYILLSFTM